MKRSPTSSRAKAFNFLRVSKIIALSAIFFCAGSEATYRKDATHKFSHSALTYCYLGGYLNVYKDWHYKSLGQELNSYIAKKIKQGQLENRFFYIKFADCPGMTPIFNNELKEDSASYSLQLSFFNLETVLNSLEYIIAKHPLPLSFDLVVTRGELSAQEKFSMAVKKTVGQPSLSFFEKELVLFELGDNFNIIYKNGALWYCFDGVCLESVDDIKFNHYLLVRSGEISDDEELPPIFKWESLLNSEHSDSRTCRSALTALKEAVHETCGGPQNIWKHRVTSWCGRETNFNGQGSFRCNTPAKSEK